jgi:ABC-type Mn2+/Zn2+ transport system permease subunit
MLYAILVAVLWCVIGYFFSVITDIPLGYTGSVALLIGIIFMNMIRKRLKK